MAKDFRDEEKNEELAKKLKTLITCDESIAEIQDIIRNVASRITKSNTYIHTYIQSYHSFTSYDKLLNLTLL